MKKETFNLALNFTRKWQIPPVEWEVIGAPGDSCPVECVDVSQNVPKTGLDPWRQ